MAPNDPNKKRAVIAVTEINVQTMCQSSCAEQLGILTTGGVKKLMSNLWGFQARNQIRRTKTNKSSIQCNVGCILSIEKFQEIYLRTTT